MNISIKNFDEKKLWDAFNNEIASIDDPNLKIKFENILIKKIRNLSYALESDNKKLYDKMKNDDSLVACPHCGLFNSRDVLCNEAKTHDKVIGTYTRLIDNGPFDGYDSETRDQYFRWATCKYCGEKIYCPASECGGGYFLGRVSARPAIGTSHA